MTPREYIINFTRLTLIPAWRRMFGKRRRGNTALLIAAFYLIAAMLSVICLTHHVNKKENDRLAAEYEQYISVADEAGTTAAQAYRHILASKLEISSIFALLMVLWGVLSVFALSRVFHATIEQDKYVWGLYVTFGSDTRSIRRQMHLEFALAALLALAAAIPTAYVACRAVYVQNGQAFRTGPAPYVQILFWLFLVSLIGAAYLSHGITRSTCIALMAAQDTSDYISSPRTSHLLGRRMYNGALRYAALAVRRMRRYYIPLVLAVSLVAAVFFGSMTVAMEGERAAARSVHEYSLEFEHGISGRELTAQYVDELTYIDAVSSVSASANGEASLLGTHLLLTQEQVRDPQSTTAVIPQGSFVATDDFRLLCADGDTRAELGGQVTLPAAHQAHEGRVVKGYNITTVPEAGTCIYLYPAERQAELAVRVGDTVRLALPREEAAGMPYEQRVAQGGDEYLTLTVADVLTVPGIHKDGTYICPRITEDHLMLHPADYSAVCDEPVAQALVLDDIYREDFALGALTAPAVLLLPEGWRGQPPSTVQMFTPTVRITERYAWVDPVDSSIVTYLESDRFRLNRTARHTLFYVAPIGDYNNDAEAVLTVQQQMEETNVPYAHVELTVVDSIVCPGLDAPCILLPNEDNFYSSFSGDMCVLSLSPHSDSPLCRVRSEVFAFGTPQAIATERAVGGRMFVHTRIESGFFEEMHRGGLVTTFPDGAAYERSAFDILGTFSLGEYTYFLCELNRDSHLAIDQYPAYMLPGDDLLMLHDITSSSVADAQDTGSYLMLREDMLRGAGNVPHIPAGSYVATNLLRVSVADSLNTDHTTPAAADITVSAGHATLVLGRDSLLTPAAGEYVQLAIMQNILSDTNDPHLLSLTDTALLDHLLTTTAYSYITLALDAVVQGDGEGDVLYISEQDWNRFRRTDGTYRTLDIHLLGDADLIELVRTSADIRELIAERQSPENYITLIEHNNLWRSVTTGACNYPAIIRLLGVLLILLLPLLWCAPQLVHFRKRRDEFAAMEAIGKTPAALRAMIAAEGVLVTLGAGAFVALLCPFAMLCIRAAITTMELPFTPVAFDVRAYLLMIAFVMLCAMLSFLAGACTILPRRERRGGASEKGESR